MFCTSSPLPAKRKRTQISYLNPDYDDLDDGEDAATAAEGDSDSDDEYGIRKKASRKGKGRKRARIGEKPKREPNKTPFPFLLLPAELRDQIYELALCEPGGLTLVSATKRFRRIIRRGAILNWDIEYYRDYRRLGRYHQSKSLSDQAEASNNQLVPNLLAVNKQIQAEAINFLYGQEIILGDTTTLHQFLAGIGPQNRKHLTALTIKGWGSDRGMHRAMNHCAFTLLAGATNLKTLFLDCQIGWVRKPKLLARQLYRDGHFFMEAYGAAKGSKGAAVDIVELNDWNYDRGNYYNWRYGRRGNDSLPEHDEFKVQFRQELEKLLGC